MSTDPESGGQGDPAPRQIGDFLLLKEIGRGGMGMVYRARQLSTNRDVALKVLPSFAGMDPEAVERFQREAEAAGRLSHPGIVPICAVGEVDGTYYFAMELVEGPSLYQLLESLKRTAPKDLRASLIEETAMAAVYPGMQERQLLPAFAGARYPASCAALASEVAAALAEAHAGKVIHRDLTPSNILIHPSGRPVLVDFGLAKDELAHSLTLTGEAVGTPSYMSPEQASGQTDLDQRVDVYGLGATLYEMLTLRPPFEGGHPGEILRRILDEDPTPPRKLNPRIPRPLETIVLTCLHKDRARRYGSALELQEDLDAFLARKRIRARRPGWPELISVRLRRNRRAALVGAASVLFALLVGLMVGLVTLNTSMTAGREALGQARILLLAGRVSEAQAAYSQAQALLDDVRLVSERRLAHFREAFDVLYNRQDYKALRAYLTSLPAVEASRSEYRKFGQRLSGAGHLRVEPAANAQGTQGTQGREGLVYLRAIRGGGLRKGWSRLLPDAALPVGRYLVRYDVPGMISSVHAVEIQRDVEQVLVPRLLALDHLPADMCLVNGTTPGSVFTIDRTELTCGAWQGVLEAIQSWDLRQEMVPLGYVENDRPYIPVSGVSFRQSRLAAALLGKHLPTVSEFRLAATGGLLELNYPWGMSFEAGRVLRDLRAGSELLPANSKEEGASPVGALHMVGNVAEVLSPDADGRLWVAGGHYLSDASSLRVKSLEALPSLDEKRSYAGLRLARFLPPGDRPELLDQWESWRQELLASDGPYVMWHWRLDEDGGLALQQQTISSGSAGSPDSLEVSGFRLKSTRKTQGGWGEPSPLVELEHEYEAVTGIFCVGDTYRLQIPRREGAEKAILRIELPTGCQVDEVWPEPELAFHAGGRPNLVWRNTRRPVFLRFRRDGLLTERWPAMQLAVKAMLGFLETMSARNASSTTTALESPFLDSRFTDQLENVRVQDVTAVGNVVTAELVLDWSRWMGSSLRFSVPDWPVRIMLRRVGSVGSQYEVVSLLPANRWDLGELQAGSYQHGHLGVRIQEQPGFCILKTSTGMTGMQLACIQATGGESSAEEADALYVIRGYSARPGEEPDSIRQKLVMGTDFRGRGERVSPSHLELVGQSTQLRLAGRSEHWLFRSRHKKGWQRERWTFLDLGRRHFLLQAVTFGASRQEARQGFRDREAWFDAVTAALRIE